LVQSLSVSNMQWKSYFVLVFCLLEVSDVIVEVEVLSWQVEVKQDFQLLSEPTHTSGRKCRLCLILRKQLLFSNNGFHVQRWF
jgi:hypothetical protein